MEQRPAAINDPRVILGVSPSSRELSDYLSALASLSSSVDNVPEPEVKCYSDALYMNYYALGLSLLFVARDGSRAINKDDLLQGDTLKLDSIDIYNAQDAQATSASNNDRLYAVYPVKKLLLPLVPSVNADKPDGSRAAPLELTELSTGKDIVAAAGEPERKGGGAGPSSGSIGIWCEWSRDGIMIEFGGEDARGPQAWERGKNAKWKVLTLFRNHHQ